MYKWSLGYSLEPKAAKLSYLTCLPVPLNIEGGKTTWPHVAHCALSCTSGLSVSKKRKYWPLLLSKNSRNRGVTLIGHNDVQLFISRAVPVEPLARLTPYVLPLELVRSGLLKYFAGTTSLISNCRNICCILRWRVHKTLMAFLVAGPANFCSMTSL